MQLDGRSQASVLQPFITFLYSSIIIRSAPVLEDETISAFYSVVALFFNELFATELLLFWNGNLLSTTTVWATHTERFFTRKNKCDPCTSWNERVALATHNILHTPNERVLLTTSFISGVAQLGGDPEVGRACVKDDGELLGRCANGDVAIVFRLGRGAPLFSWLDLSTSPLFQTPGTGVDNHIVKDIHTSHVELHFGREYPPPHHYYVPAEFHSMISFPNPAPITGLEN